MVSMSLVPTWKVLDGIGKNPNWLIVMPKYSMIISPSYGLNQFSCLRSRHVEAINAQSTRQVPEEESCLRQDILLILSLV
jgi:hypothetical protein